MPRRRRRYSSYEGEISEAPENTLLEGGHPRLPRDHPNELLGHRRHGVPHPGRQVLPVPHRGLLHGMPIAWTISTSPDAEMANSALGGMRAAGERGTTPGPQRQGMSLPLARLDAYEGTGSCGRCREGRSPDNSRMEGFFRKAEGGVLSGHDWQDVSMERSSWRR